MSLNYRETVMSINYDCRGNEDVLEQIDREVFKLRCKMSAHEFMYLKSVIS